MIGENARIPLDKIEEVRLAADIVEVVGSRVRLTKKGKDFWGICPFHGDTDPSFKVDRERGTWYCFGCQEGGSIFNFLMKDQGLSFPEAVRHVAARYGVTLPSPKLSPEQRQAQKQRERLYSVMELAADFFAKQLQASSAKAGRDYLFSQRGLDKETVSAFGLGWAPEGWENLKRLLLSRKVPEDLAVKAGVLVAKEKGGTYDRFRERVIFPIRDPGGHTVSFGGRLMGKGEPKYLNGPESPLFNKSQMLYNLDKARPAMRKNDRAILVEGYFDVITLAAHGFAETVAPLGTALTAWQVRRLRSQASDLVVVFDGDEAGQKAAERALSIILNEGVSARALMLPPGEDPDSYVRSQGPEALAKALDAARPLTEMVLDRIIRAAGLSTPEGRSAAVDKCGPVLKAIKDPVTRWGYVEYVAGSLKLSPDMVRVKLGLELPGRFAEPKKSTALQNSNPHLNAERSLLELALANPSAAEVLAQGGALEDISDPKLAAVGRAIGEVLGQGGEASAGAVSNALDDPSLASLVVDLSNRAPRLAPEEAKAEAQHLLRLPQRRRLQRQRKAMTVNIREAEAAGDKQKVSQLQLKRKKASQTDNSFHAGKE